MIRFGMHSSFWTSAWTREGAERSVTECARHGLQVVEIALLEPDIVDVQHSLSLFERHGVAPTASLCLPAGGGGDAPSGGGAGVPHARARRRPCARLQHADRRHLFDARLPLRRGADRGRVRRDRAGAEAGRQARRRLRHDARPRGLQSLRDPPRQHGGPGPRARPAHRRAGGDDPPRHLSRQYRGEELRRRARRRRRARALMSIFRRATAACRAPATSIGAA